LFYINNPTPKNHEKLHFDLAMKLIFLLMIFSFSVVYAEPKTIDNSPKLCLETIYKKNFDAAL